jgi:hypothetical protein
VNHRRGHEAVAVILAVGVSASVALFVFAVTYDSIMSSDAGLSDNAAQVLTGAIGGMIGVLGGYIGGRSSRDDRRDENERSDDPRT